MKGKYDVELKWYIVHTYSGFEHKVKANLEGRIKTLGQEDYFGKILFLRVAVINIKKDGRKRGAAGTR